MITDSDSLLAILYANCKNGTPRACHYVNLVHPLGWKVERVRLCALALQGAGLVTASEDAVTLTSAGLAKAKTHRSK